MKFRSSWLTAFLVGACLAGAVGLIPAQSAVAQEKLTPSREAAKQLKAAQEAYKAHKYQDALAKLKEADAVKKTPIDQHLINELSAAVYVALKDYNQAVKYFEAQLNEGSVKESDQQQLVKYIAKLSYQTQNYDKALEFGNRAIKGGFADAAIRTIVAQSYYQKGDWKGTKRFMDEEIAAQVKKGETPKAESLQMLQSACEKLEDSDCQTRAIEAMVQFYPKPEYWENLLYGLTKSSQVNDQTQLQLYRLMLEVNVLKRPQEYTEMAQLALEQGSPGEAQHIIEKGFENKIFADQRQQDKNHRLLEAAKKAVATDLPSLPKREQAAEAAATGEEAVSVGNAYLGYQQYDKAIAFLSKGIAKGGLKDPHAAQMLLGVAYLRGGHRDEAIKAFRQVKGDPMVVRIANLWALHAKQPDAVAHR